MKFIKRFSLIIVAVLVLSCSVPLSSLAVDPISAVTMGNAFAQAITAYGASQGVSMTFDVANTDGIGQGVHELWDKYQADMANSNVSVSDYQNLAISAFPKLWIKIGENIAVNLDAASVGEIDGFWNWLLSGPAEMTKVDNQYYEWTIDSTSGSVLPITVNSNSYITLNGKSLFGLPYTLDYVGQNKLIILSSTYSNAYYIPIKFSNDASYGRVWALIYSDSRPSVKRAYVDNSWSGTENCIKWTGNWWYYDFSDQVKNNISYYSTNLTTNNSGLQVLADLFGNPPASLSSIEGSDNIFVQPYTGDTVPQDVYIPDNTDVNYQPTPASIPIDIPWDDALFGDGTSILSDAQSEAITDAVNQAIADNPAKTIELADTTNPPIPSPSEVYIPFLPVTLPSFQFSLSGIWHYVTAWVSSLGAWFSLVFTTWSYLPYAISVPVYATAVIVIVLGVYKRFFM